MTNKLTNWLLLGALGSILLATAIAYQYVPEQIAVHWNLMGDADGYMTKFWGLIFMPALIAGMFLLYHAIPKMDPLRDNLKAFRKDYNLFWVFLFGFFAYLFALTLAWNLGQRFNFGVALLPALSILIYFMGVILGRSKRNWFVGIRTPWTLSNDKVWDKTHKLGSKLFKLSAAISLLGMFFENETLVLFITIPLFASAIILVVYSYAVFLKVKK